MIIRTLTILLICIPLIAERSYSEQMSGQTGADMVRTSINWPDIDGAVEYEVQITDVNYKTAFKKRVKESQIDFSLPAGEYRVRIGVINKFYKISSWSDWAVFMAEEKKAKEKKEAVKEKLLASNSVKIGIGVPYFHILSTYNKNLNNSWAGGMINFAGGMSNIVPFLHWSFLNYMGLEIEGVYIKFKGKEIPNRVTTNKLDILAGGNFFFTTNFDLPVNLILRGGVGLLQTKFEYESSVYSDLKEFQDRALTSIDYYYKAGASVQYVFAKYLFAEIGADIYDFVYVSDTFRVACFFCRAGIML